MSEKSAGRSIRNCLREGASEAENRRNIAGANLHRQSRLSISLPLSHVVNIADRRAEEAKVIGQSEAAQRRGE